MNESIVTLEKELSLPDLDIFPLDAPGAASYYGIGEIARAYCGLPYMPRNIPGSWAHGWHPDHYHIHPALLWPSARTEGHFWFLRQNQGEYFRQQGFPNSKAIGHPLVYMPDPGLSRRPDSLLVMPGRSFPGFPIDQDCLYAEEVGKLREQFAEVVVCISPQSFNQGDWVEGFHRLGLPIIRGAWGNDRNGFNRLIRIMNQFEYVTTNAMGSQIAYAAYLGAKVSVWGPRPVVPPPDKPIALFSKYPDLRETFHKALSVETLLEHEPWLDVQPREARLMTDWGAAQMGLENRLSPAELAVEFRLTPEQMRNWPLELEEILTLRNQIRRRAEDQEKHYNELKATLAEMKLEARTRESALKSAQKELVKLREYTSSAAWQRVGRRLYSLEKRLRRKSV